VSVRRYVMPSLKWLLGVSFAMYSQSTIALNLSVLHSITAVEIFWFFFVIKNFICVFHTDTFSKSPYSICMYNTSDLRLNGSDFVLSHWWWIVWSIKKFGHKLLLLLLSHSILRYELLCIWMPIGHTWSKLNLQVVLSQLYHKESKHLSLLLPLTKPC